MVEGLHHEPVDSEQAATASLRRLARAQGLRRSVCSLVLSPPEHQLLQVEAPDVEAGELRAAIRWKIKDIIDCHIDDAVFDVFDAPASRSASGSMMFVAVCRSHLISRRVASMEAADLALSVIDIGELALRNISSLLAEDVSGVAMLYLDEDHGVINLTRQGNLYLSRRLELGWRSLQDVDDAGGRTERLDSLVLEVQRSLDYYESHHGQAPASALYVAPTPAPLSEPLAYLRANLGIEVKVLDLDGLLSWREPGDPALITRCLLPLGAALRSEQVTL